MRDEIRKTTKFMIEEFTVELTTNRFNFDPTALAEDIYEGTDFSKAKAQQIADEVMIRLKTFAKDVRTAKAAAIR